MTRRSWIMGASAAVAPLKGLDCTGQCNDAPIPAPDDLFPEALVKANPKATHFDLVAYADLPVPATLTNSGTSRISASQMPNNPTALSLLRRGYHAMIIDSGYTGLAVQATLHKWFCPTNGIPDAHGLFGGEFLAWHRAFLYFHERVLRWQLEKAGVAGADTVRLPYWDVTTFAESGGIYCDCAELLGANCRTWSPVDSGTASTAAGSLLSSRTDTALQDCATDLYNWHIQVHEYVGGNMGSIPIAAFDPIFYALHASVDHWWTKSPTFTNQQPASHTCIFYDPYAGNGGSWVKVDLANFGNNPNLGITYTEAGGILSWLGDLPELGIVEVILPAPKPGSTLYVTAPGFDGFSFGRVLIDHMHDDHHGQTLRLALQPKLEESLRKASHENVRFYVKDVRGARIDIASDKWRLLVR